MKTTLNTSEVHELENAIKAGSFFTAKTDCIITFADGEKITEQQVTVFKNELTITRKDIGFFGANNSHIIKSRKVDSAEQALSAISESNKKDVVKG